MKVFIRNNPLKCKCAMKKLRNWKVFPFHSNNNIASIWSDPCRCYHWTACCVITYKLFDFSLMRPDYMIGWYQGDKRARTSIAAQMKVNFRNKTTLSGFDSLSFSLVGLMTSFFTAIYQIKQYDWHKMDKLISLLCLIIFNVHYSSSILC